MNSRFTSIQHHGYLRTYYFGLSFVTGVEGCVVILMMYVFCLVCVYEYECKQCGKRSATDGLDLIR